MILVWKQRLYRHCRWLLTKDLDEPHHPGLPQFLALVGRGNSEVVDAVSVEMAGQRYAAVSIGVGLDHSHHFWTMQAKHRNGSF